VSISAACWWYAAAAKPRCCGRWRKDCAAASRQACWAKPRPRRRLPCAGCSWRRKPGAAPPCCFAHTPGLRSLLRPPSAGGSDRRRAQRPSPPPTCGQAGRKCGRCGPDRPRPRRMEEPDLAGFSLFFGACPRRHPFPGRGGAAVEGGRRSFGLRRYPHAGGRPSRRGSFGDRHPDRALADRTAALPGGRSRRMAGGLV
jgi:hypothetical protein